MTRDQLDAIRARVDFNDVSIHDVIPLLAEVQRLQEENTVLVEANEGEPWAWQILTKQRDAALAEVERLTAEVESKVAQNVALIGQNGRLQQEVERLTAERETFWRVLSRVSEFLDGCVGCDTPSICFGTTRNMKAEVQDALAGLSHVGILEYAAFKRGVAAMRQAILEQFDWHNDARSHDRVRALPDPEDK